MYKCKVCGKEFELQKENHYVSISRTPTGLAALISSETVMYDAFDCTHCGCQNRVSERYVNYANTMAGMAVDEEESEEEHECFGDYCGEYKCDDCGSEIRCLKETVFEAQNTLKKYRNEKNMEVVKEGLEQVPKCFGNYKEDKENEVACRDCKAMAECVSAECVSESWEVEEEEQGEEQKENKKEKERTEKPKKKPKKKSEKKPGCFGDYNEESAECRDNCAFAGLCSTEYELG